MTSVSWPSIRASLVDREEWRSSDKDSDGEHRPSGLFRRLGLSVRGSTWNVGAGAAETLGILLPSPSPFLCEHAIDHVMWQVGSIQTVRCALH